MLAGNQLRQIAALLVRLAVASDLIDAKIGMRAIGEAHGSRTAADFFHGNDVFEIAETGTSPLFLDRDAVQAERAHLRPKLAWKHIGAIDLLCDRRDLVSGESANRLSQRVRGLAEIVFKRAVVGTGHTWTPFWQGQANYGLPPEAPKERRVVRSRRLEL